ncbi:MAG: GIY-YIG nuclease family protein [Chloroflexia bacterium]
MRRYYIYIMSSQSKTLYVGMTNHLERRVYEHKNKILEGFTSKYNLTSLVCRNTIYQRGHHTRERS